MSTQTPSTLTHVLLPAAVCWALFVNHYARDVTGALEREIEADIGISPTAFQTLNSVYFAPSLVAPLVTGAIAQRCGATKTLIAIMALATVGHLAMAIGSQRRSYEALVFGRIVLGVTYESIDILPLPILGALYKQRWGLLVGFFNGALRLGSVVNFGLSPAVYSAAGLSAAFWVSAAFGVSGLVTAVFAFVLENAVRSASTQTALGSTEPCGDEHGSDHSFSQSKARNYILYTVTGALAYSAIVPFWFYGSAFIRDKWGCDLSVADALMMFPEGGMVVLSPPIGMFIDRFTRRERPRVHGLIIFLIFVVLGFALLISAPASLLPPLVPLAVLGIAWAGSNTVFWSMSSTMVPQQCYALGAGLLGSALNVGASILPLVMARARSGEAALAWLAGAAALGCFTSLLLSLSLRREVRSSELSMDLAAWGGDRSGA